MLPAAEGQVARSIPLREVARFSYTQGLNQISRENGKRMVVVQVNVRGRDLGGFVTEAQDKIGKLDLPPGMYTAWGGTFESLQSARLRLLIVVPICFVAIYALLYLALGGFIPAAIVFSAVPMALRRRVRAIAAWHTVLDHRSRRVHRAVRRRSAQRSRDDERDPQTPRGWCR